MAQGSPTVTIGGNVYGGGNNGKVEQNANVTVKSGTFEGDIYGGGNLGDLDGKTEVVLQGGDFQSGVFGGARMANVGKYSYVNVDGAGQLHDITANFVFGGNDISGTIGRKLDGSESLPFVPEVNEENTVVDNTWTSYILTTEEKTSDLHIFIGQMFGGGNGDYTYEEGEEDTEYEGKYLVKRYSDGAQVAVVGAVLPTPTVGKTYMQVNGGTFGYVFAGGNAATVTNDAVISINNESTVTTRTDALNVAGYTAIDDLDAGALDNPVDERLLAMGLNLSTFNNDRNFIRIFGGNNKADMIIRPIWNLQKGSIHNLYSGGNEGRMTSSEGILLEIAEGSEIVADNVYGGCRKADVRPLMYANGAWVDVPNGSIQLSDAAYKFPSGFSARVLVRGGNIQNVYGGNDISGNVYGGNAVGVYTSISGDIYGGGNGSYSYTDNAALKGDLIWGDFYYNPDAVLTAAGLTATSDKLKSVEALNAFRPNAEQVSIRIYGKDANHPTLVGGSIYVGGNSASVKPQSLSRIPNAKVHLKIGSYAIADYVFLGNNGEQMVDSSANGVLERYAGTVIKADKTTDVDFSTLDLTDADIFAKYMEGCAMRQIPSVKFDSKKEGDPDDYEDYSATFGSIFCGGNVGSMILDGKTEINFNHHITVIDKVVGGCNNANVLEHAGLNARFDGGFLTPGSTGPVVGEEGTAIVDKLELNLEGLNIKPMRWKGTKNAQGKYTSYDLDAYGNRQLEWNTVTYNALTGKEEEVTPPTTLPAGGISTEADLARRLKGGNVYGGCYNSGHIDGNVVINLNGSILDEKTIFDEVESEGGEAKLYENDTYMITTRHSGVILDEQGMDVLGTALNVFGGGYGRDSEVWGSTTVNLKKGYTFQIYGGGEHGAVGKGVRNPSTGILEYNTYDSRFSSYVNLKGEIIGVPKGDDNDDESMASAEFIYGGGFEGTIVGNTVIHLGSGRIFNSFAGSCNADILGHTETYVGLTGEVDGKGVEQLGFPYVRDHIYGGNDLGGKIHGEKDFMDRVREDMEDIKTKIYDAEHSTKASAYIEYQQGRVDYIFGGCYGSYDYTDRQYEAYTYDNGDSKKGFTKPRLGNAFVNFRPTDYYANAVNRIYGAGEGHIEGIGIDSMQMRSYVLIDLPQEVEHNFEEMEVFGAGAWSGLGMGVSYDTAAAAPDEYSAVVDLFRGNIKNVYGGSFTEGVTRRTVINVPEGSTINVQNIFGGAYGTDTYLPCDVYEANVNFASENAYVTEAIFGGNNNERRTVYGKVNITAPVHSSPSNSSYLSTVYGAGRGGNTWAEYTEVNLENGAQVYEVYGGGKAGKVHNAESIQKFMNAYKPLGMSDVKWKAAWTLGSDYDPEPFTFGPTSNCYIDYENYTKANLHNSNLVRRAEMDDRSEKTYTYNTNVLIKDGAKVVGYAYGGGLGAEAVIAGTTYIALLGGTVGKDLYAAGTSGSVEDLHNAGNFIASANVYIEGGTARNVYGGGWEGAVGKHRGGISASYDEDIFGETHVVIGKLDGTSYIDGIPAIQRNAYGGGEGGAVFGTTYLTLNNGYVGYVYKGIVTHEVDVFDDGGNKTGSQEVTEPYYEEKINDETWTDHIGENRLYDSGCVFGGGYIDNSNVDNTRVTMLGGYVRNSLFGGGEIAAVGRGETNSDRSLRGIYKAGTTSVHMYDGHVFRDVFGGGRGYNNLGEHGTLYSDGFVFGKTEVDIYGGEIGTAAGVSLGYGNVFGGGDIGYVYSAYEYEEGGKVKQARGMTSGARYDDGDEGYYYEYKDGDYVMDGTEKVMTEDCKVLVEPQCKVRSAVTINGESYEVGEYVPIDILNNIGNKNDATWTLLDDKGIIIHNAVFAGGNTSSGSDQVYANATTVYGNATASIHDVYHRDLITVGTGHTGGLYGDGNLTFVDGYRGLNITNYGTDYYSIATEITLEQYRGLPARERAYYELRYRCVRQCTDSEGKVYSVNSTITTGELITLFRGVQNIDGEDILDETGRPNSKDWVENGVVSRYAGRPMNTIQRADFCGVFGSRMVMQGAQDRVPEIVDYTNYTINRVREVSLNLRESTIAGDRVKKGDGAFVDANKAEHGNYFGIYNIVNYLGALTSDVDFGDESGGDVRTSSNKDQGKYGPDTEGQTFYDWKKRHIREQKRNNGNSHNQVALASGVYLELTTEKSRGDDLYEKEWGLITGVIELDLINVQPGIGGGFVYAKNEHGIRTKTPKKHATLTRLNNGAVTKADFTYATLDTNKKEWQTSGNFVHSEQIIIDDCYNISGKYKTGDGVPAHYWYIKGNVYVYDQYISAYTGAPNAYSESVNIPLTITAASHGTMKLLNVQPNRYAYWSANIEGNQVSLDGGKKLVINDVTYEQNTPISYWDYYLLSASEKRLFEANTYVVTADCKIGETEYKGGKILLSTDYKTLRESGVAGAKPTVTWRKMVDGVEQDVVVDFDYVFRSSNNLAHDTGYILTYEVNNPNSWNKWYTPENGNSFTGKLSTAEYNKDVGYNDGPTYYLKDDAEDGVFGQQAYKVGNIIAKKIYDDYADIQTHHSEAIPTSDDKTQAEFERAYIVTKELEHITTKGGVQQHLYPGASIAQSDYSTEQWAAMSGSVAEAYVCTSTIQLDKTEYIYANTLMTKTEYDGYIADYSTLEEDIVGYVVPAYYCTTAGLYGGKYYEKNKNYRALEVWSSMSKEDRVNFVFNYDALDLLIDPTYGGIVGDKYQYDSSDKNLAGAEANRAHYSLEQPVDYTATYEGRSEDDTTPLTYTDKGGTAHSVDIGSELSREAFETIPNEQRHFSSFRINEVGTLIGDKYYVYIANTSFQIGDMPYAVGQTLRRDTYNGLSEDDPEHGVEGDKDKVTELIFSESDGEETFYYCREEYEVGHQGEGHAIETYAGVTYTTAAEDVGGSYAIGDDVPVGAIIDQTEYTDLTNKQKHFLIHGIAPIETSTLYVARESDINDLSTEKIITVIYQYDYEESDEDGMHIVPVSERHVVNIHIRFKSGVPDVEDIPAPKIVLPGTSISVRTPNVTPGAYEVTGGGWEIFEKISDAESHTNGVEFTPVRDPLYWYQNGYYVAYYAQTYLGKTYSNHVPLSVANYHDMADVMADQAHHMYIDNEEVDREPKIYINDYSAEGKNGLDLFKNLIDLSYIAKKYDSAGNPVAISTEGPLNGHVPLDLTHTTGLTPKPMRGGEYLEFYLRSDQSHEDTPWTPIANEDGECFSGILHGDGYTISGLSNSLFNHLCGSVYNLGVTGSFTGAGVAETGDGYVENCWVKTTGTPAKVAEENHFAVFGNPSRFGDNLVQIVNCYYPESNDYQVPASDDHGLPRQMPDQSFYNGEVTYDLNAFYLNKRFYDSGSSDATTALGASPVGYKYYALAADGSIPTNPETDAALPEMAYYPVAAEAQYGDLGYVEDRFADGDFIYAGGSIPETVNERFCEDDGRYYPIWPDDYLFFGQMLTYGHVDNRIHQPQPSHINKSGDRLTTTPTSVNRVYRAPAYFRSSTMGLAHYNLYAVFASQSADKVQTAYPNMTAIDFTGGNGDVAGGYKLGLQSAKNFYPPLLDDDGLSFFRNVDLTKNLLVYVPIATGIPTDAASKTNSAVNTALNEPTYTETDPDYRTIARQDIAAVYGHPVELTGEGYRAKKDHFLVDKQDFNAPIAYTLASGKRIWYQRRPENYVDHTMGWEGISLPFSAELVTTQDKGEITHFYGGSDESKNGTHTKIGHEYWLREFVEGGSVSAEDDKVFVANFTYPDKITAGADKEYTNTYLWDHYYSYSERRDANEDKYKTYYQTPHKHEEYGYLVVGRPYIIGFPGETYYEFDLSGNFKPLNTLFDIDRLPQQIITFASHPGATVNVSDTEMDEAQVKEDGYVFMPNYLGGDLAIGSYVLNSEGDSYVVTSTVTQSVPFRPYFVKATGESVKPVHYIQFSGINSAFGNDEQPDSPELEGRLDVQTRRGGIIVSSTLRDEANVCIVSTAGFLMTSFVIQPGETVDIPIYVPGVYIVNQKKVIVK